MVSWGRKLKKEAIFLHTFDKLHDFLFVGSMLMGGAMPVYALLFGEVLGILKLDTEEARQQSIFYSSMFLGKRSTCVCPMYIPNKNK